MLWVVIELVIEVYFDDMKCVISSDVLLCDVFEEIIVCLIVDVKDVKYNVLFWYFLLFVVIDVECLKLCEEWYLVFMCDFV